MHTRTTLSNGVRMRPRTEHQVPRTPRALPSTTPSLPCPACHSGAAPPESCGPQPGGPGPRGKDRKGPAPGPPYANCCEWGLPAWGLGSVSALFSGEKGHCPHHHLGPHCCLVPGRRLLDSRIPTPLSQVSFCVSGDSGGPDTVWFSVLFFKLLSVWVSVCMKWNKLCPLPAPLLYTCTALVSALTWTGTQIPTSAPSTSHVTTRVCTHTHPAPGL